MATHVEDHEDQLGGAQKLPTKGAPEDLARVGHAVHLGIPLFELADDISCVGCDAGYAEDDDDAARLDPG